MRRPQSQLASITAISMTALVDEEDLPKWLSQAIWEFARDHFGYPPKYILVGHKEARILKATMDPYGQVTISLEQFKPGPAEFIDFRPGTLIRRDEPEHNTDQHKDKRNIRLSFHMIPILEVDIESFMDLVWDEMPS